MVPKLLKPDVYKILLTVVVLSLPLFTEHITLESGEVVTERIIPIFLAPAYLSMGEFYPLLLILGFYLFVYFVASLLISLFRR